MAGECRTADGSWQACTKIAGRLRILGPAGSFARGINEGGVVTLVIHNGPNGNPLPYVWSPGTGRRALDVSGFVGGYAYDVNDPGQVVGSLFDDLANPVATRWRRIGRFTADHPHGTWALSVNNIGRVAGYAVNPDVEGGEGGGNTYPILWRLGRIIKLPLHPDFSSGFALDINNRGEIAGTQVRGEETESAVLWRVIE